MPALIGGHSFRCVVDCVVAANFRSHNPSIPRVYRFPNRSKFGVLVDHRCPQVRMAHGITDERGIGVSPS